MVNITKLTCATQELTEKDKSMESLLHKSQSMKAESKKESPQPVIDRPQDALLSDQVAPNIFDQLTFTPTQPFHIIVFVEN